MVMHRNPHDQPDASLLSRARVSRSIRSGQVQSRPSALAGRRDERSHAGDAPPAVRLFDDLRAIERRIGEISLEIEALVAPMMLLAGF